MGHNRTKDLFKEKEFIGKGEVTGTGIKRIKYGHGLCGLLDRGIDMFDPR